MTSSLVGSEMCIRDSAVPSIPAAQGTPQGTLQGSPVGSTPQGQDRAVSYTHLTLPTICSV
eukprot:12296988-Prorocentrum_lima.AAC.1